MKESIAMMDIAASDRKIAPAALPIAAFAHPTLQARSAILSAAANGSAIIGLHAIMD